MNIFQYLEKNFPPTLFIFGEADKWKKASDKMVADLKGHDKSVEVWMGRGRPEIEQWECKTNSTVYRTLALRKIFNARLKKEIRMKIHGTMSKLDVSVFLTLFPGFVPVERFRARCQ